MTTEKGETPDIFDAEWECLKLRRMIMDVVDMIDDLKAKDRSLSARISRLKTSMEQTEGEEEWEEEREPEGHDLPSSEELHKLSPAELQRRLFG
jgi:hypothetical protein